MREGDTAFAFRMVVVWGWGESAFACSLLCAGEGSYGGKPASSAGLRASKTILTGLVLMTRISLSQASDSVVESGPPGHPLLIAAVALKTY